MFLALACWHLPDEGIPVRGIGPAAYFLISGALVLLDLHEVAGLGLGQLAELVHDLLGDADREPA